MLLYLFYIFFAGVASICYYPNNQGPSPQDLPCFDSTGPSNCCGPEYECLSNKICRQTHTNRDGSFANFTYGRGSCTDQTWRASECPSFCLTQWSGKATTNYCATYFLVPQWPSADFVLEIAMYKCPNTTLDTYCCKAQDGSLGNCDCSATGGAARPLHFSGTPSILTTIGVTGSTISATPSATTTGNPTTNLNTSSSASQTSPTSSTMPSSPSPLPSNDHSTTIGAAVGVPLGTICLAALLAFIYRRLRRKRAATNLKELDNDKGVVSIDQVQSKLHHELLASTAEHEMPAEPGQHELPVAPPELPGRTRHHELP